MAMGKSTHALLPGQKLVEAISSAPFPEAPTDGRHYVRRGSDTSWQPENNGNPPIDPAGLVPAGGNIGEVLTKTGIPSYDMDWVPPAGAFDDSHLVALDGSRPMVGPLFLLLAPPTQNEHAANKAYVDNSIAAIPPDVPFDDSHLLTLDGTRPMLAELILSGPPTLPLAATTKAYVDALVTGEVGSLLIGVIDASTGVCRFIPDTGILPNPGPLPPANAATKGDYVMCEEAGLIPGGPAAGIIMNKGDWLFCTGTAWILFEVGTGVGAITATDVIVIPAVLGLSNVQDVLQAIEALLGGVVDPTGLYLLLTGGTLTGMLVLPATVPTLPAHATNKQYVDDQLTVRGLPPGGQAGTVLVKNTNASYDTNWIAIPTSLVPIGPTPPAAPEEGQLWFRDTDLDLYIWYNDGTNTNWVPASTGNANGLPPGGTQDQILAKRSVNNFDVEWRDVAGGPGGPGIDFLPLTGGTLTGDLILPGGTPPTPGSAVHRQYVDSLVSSGNLYRGAWRVGTNTPALPTNPDHGTRYLCETANVNTPETPPGTIPGLTGRLIGAGSFVIWDSVVNGGQWDLLANSAGGLTQAQADARYLQLAGGTATGKIVTPATLAADPATTLATKGYIDDKIFNDAGVGPWVGVTNGAQWTGTSVQCRLINGGANIQCRGKVSFNNQAFSGSNFQAFQLPTTHTPGGIGGAVSPATDSATEQTTLRSSMSFNWNTGDRWIYASRTYTTVASPRIASIDLIIPRT